MFWFPVSQSEYRKSYIHFWLWPGLWQIVLKLSNLPPKQALSADIPAAWRGLFPKYFCPKWSLLSLVSFKYYKKRASVSSGYPTPRNKWKHEALGRVFLLFLTIALKEIINEGWTIRIVCYPIFLPQQFQYQRCFLPMFLNSFWDVKVARVASIYKFSCRSVRMYRGILVYNICLISISNSVFDGITNISLPNIERPQYD